MIALFRPPRMREVQGWQSLKLRVVVGVLALVLLGMWSVAVYTSRTLRETVKAQIHDQQWASVNLLARDIDKDLDDRRTAVISVARDIPAEYFERPSEMQRFLVAHPVFQRMFNAGTYVADIHGTAIASVPTSLGRVGVNYMDRPEVAAAIKEGKTGISGPLIGRVLKAPVFYVATPVRNPQGQVIGALVGLTDLSTANFLDDFQGLTRGSNTYFLIDPTLRMVITASDKRYVMLALAAPGVVPAMDRILAGHEGPSLYVNQVGVPQLTASKRLSVNGWIVHASLPEKEAFAPVDALQWRIVLVTAFLTLVMGVATWWMLRRVLAPMFEASRMLSEQAQSDEVPQALPVARKDEIGQLITGFNRLIAKVGQREQALKESQARYRAAFQTSPDAITICRMDNGLYLEASESFAQMFGWTVQEVIGKTVDDIHIWRRADQRQLLIDAVAQGKSLVDLEVELVRKDGQVITALVSAQVLEVGGLTCLLSVTRDITERKASEDALRRLNQHYASLVNCNQAITRSTSEEALFHALCRNAVEFSGMKMAWIGLIDEDRQEVVQAAAFGESLDYLEGLAISVKAQDLTRPGPVGKAIQDDQPVWVHDFDQPDDGVAWRAAARRFGWKAVGALPLHRKGAVIGVLSLYSREADAFDEGIRNLLVRMTEDISFALDSLAAEASRKAAQAQLRKLSLAVTQSPSSIVITDTEARIEFANDAFVKSSGYQREDLIGRSAGMLQSGKTSAETIQGMWTALRSGQSWTGEFINRRKDGSEYVLRAIVSPLYQEDGVVTNYVTVLEDITEKKRMALELDRYRNHLEELVRTRTLELTEARRQADAANAAKSEFLANMSHEIRTPMNAILGFSDLMLKSTLDPQQRRYMGIMQRAGESLLGVINDILDFSKIEAGKLSMEVIDFQPEDVLHNVGSVLGLKAASKGLELVFELPPDLPASLQGDPLRLGQVLMNLGNNAVKFTHRGEVVIGVEKVAAAANTVTLHFWVRDTGIGMTPEQQSRIFQPFGQADSSTTRQFGGTGLGLMISKSLVEMMQGRIWVDSESGKGSVFHFEASFGMAAPPQPEPGLQDPALRGLRTLLVDDNAAARESAAGMARAFGLAVDGAASAHEALALIAQAQAGGAPYQLVLADADMPAMDGVQMLARLQQEAPSAPPAVIMVTPTGLEGALDAARQQKVSLHAVVTKPVTPAILRMAILESLDKDARAEPAGPHDDQALRGWMAQLRGARVLLAEDTDTNRELALDLLGRAGIEVVAVGNGQEVLDTLAADARFDGVLMDCQMPVMDGYTATRELRKMAAFKHLPVLAMTANTMVGDREKALEAGMEDHIGKPLDTATLFATMARWIKPSSPAPAAARPLGELTQDLRALLLQGNPEASALWQAHEAAFKRAYPALASQIGHRLHAFDFEAALELLDQAA